MIIGDKMNKSKDLLITIIAMGCATMIAQLFTLFTNNPANTSISYIFFIVLISRYTSGYRWGVIASIFSVFAINFLFTYPYFKINFTLSGYPLTFFGLLLISIFCSAITAHAKEQTRIANEREMMMIRLNDFNRSLLISKDSDQTIDITLAYIHTLLHCDCLIYFEYEDIKKQTSTCDPACFEEFSVKTSIAHVLKEQTIFKDHHYTYLPLDQLGVVGIKDLNSDTSLTYLSLIVQQSAMNLEKQVLQDTHHRLSVETEKEKMRANLLRAISHDLRTPLTNMIGASATYIEAKEHLSQEERDRLVASIHEDSNWLLHMVENLLSVTRIRQEETKVTKTAEAVEEIAAESITRVKKRYPDTQIKVTVPDEYLLVPMDATLIEQVIINLIENAIKYAKSTQPIELIVTKTDTHAVFDIIDYGVGFDTEDMETIFDSYRSNDASKGMGIGLSICKTIILAHDGEIFAKKNPLGTQFTFLLPLGGQSYES